MTTQLDLDQFIVQARQAGCPADQLENFTRAGIVLQPRQFSASVAARLCDATNGPTAIGYGGARGGGKTHWLLAQMGADDCQRRPGLKCLLLRRVGKSNLENFEDFRQRLFSALPHSFNASRGLLTFANGSRIVAGHYQCEKDIDAYLGLEYDVIGIEEATTLTARKYQDILTCLRTSKPDWRPRLYSTTNPGGIGHEWYFNTYIVPHQRGTETSTRFIPARVDDNKFTNPQYREILDSRTGWQLKAWRDGSWDIAAGQFFQKFRPEVHILDDFNDHHGAEWFAAMDYGYTHYTVVLLGCRDFNDNIIIVDEHAARHLLPQQHAEAIHAMLHRHKVLAREPNFRPPPVVYPGREYPAHLYFRKSLLYFVAGGDVFGTESTGRTIASQYAEHGFRFRPANTSRASGWGEILSRLGDPDRGLKPTLYIHKRCTRLLNCLPYLQHDPDQPGDVLKTNTNDEGLGGDDAADALRYLLNYKPVIIEQRKLRGL